ncbi:hypothetical protein FQN57_003820 [Myotisia sp. PD_48]|nr:hypothetical protein FQN57_003820 [Myotisia sp. PD_48]
MKDLYTFDYNETEAMKTYNAVKDTYVNLFDELGIPYLVATAASGNMGGKFSHEFHFPSPKGEDTVVSCSSCGHTFNEELASGKARVDLRNQQSTVKTQASTGLGCQEAPAVSTGQWTSISKDKRVLVRAFYPKYLLHDGESNPVEREINTHALKSVVDAYGVNLDNSVQDPFSVWKAKVETDPTDPGGDMRVLDVYDYRVRVYDRPPIGHLSPHMSQNIRYELLKQFPNSDNCLDLLRAKTGDECTNCREPTLKTDHAIEIAHTFHLGTRYSDILDAKVAVKPALVKKMDQKSDKEIIVPLQMGCHGIGVSRMMCAVADALADDRGLNWPQAIAPFQAVIVPAKGLEKEAEQVYDKLLAHGEDSMDIILDDRPRDLPWKLRDADLVGYPIILVVGKKSWASENKVEVQCRRMGDLRDTVHLDELPVYVKSLLSKLS